MGTLMRAVKCQLSHFYMECISYFSRWTLGTFTALVLSAGSNYFSNDFIHYYFFMILNKVKSSNKGFTLVELIVTVVIIAILSTVGFVSYSRHLQWVRDTARVDQLTALMDALDISKTKGDLLLPEDPISIKANGGIIGYQGKLGDSILQAIEVRDGGKDPKDGTPFTYYVSKDRKTVQLLAYQEEIPQPLWFLPTAYARDYSTAYPVVRGASLGALIDVATNAPIEQVATIQTAGFLDIATTTNQYIAVFTNSKKITGTGVALIDTISNRSCRRILETGGSYGDGIYSINPTGTGNIDVYCDMTTEWGGRTFFWHYNENAVGNNFFDAGVGTYRNDRVDDATTYSIGSSKLWGTEMIGTFDIISIPDAIANGKILFVKYTLWDPRFNKWPVPCINATTPVFSKVVLGSSKYQVMTPYCDANQMYLYTPGATWYIIFYVSALGQLVSTQLWWNGNWYHDGWWYVR